MDDLRMNPRRTAPHTVSKVVRPSLVMENAAAHALDCTGNLGETSNSVEVCFLPFQFLFNP